MSHYFQSVLEVVRNAQKELPVLYLWLGKWRSANQLVELLANGSLRSAWVCGRRAEDGAPRPLIRVHCPGHRKVELKDWSCSINICNQGVTRQNLFRPNGTIQPL